MTDIHRADSARVQPPGAAHDLDELSTVQLVERLTDQLTGLVRTEMTHALTEVKDKGTRFGIGAGVSGVGVLLLLYGFGALVATAILGLATTLDPWLAALIVAAVLIIVGSVVAAVGARRAKNALPPVPEHTADSVRADVDTVKEGLR
ncbi:membrane protein [Rhodococcus percolatus]|uniref:phage holin family protein n=1 Tax=Rhodococcus opacus TaxID=37919 RepID=UPI0015F7E209|nr:phage holin family protein [Rhodococcus opacus]MBA8963341.1 membrane protein [Rhodococcus opacus]MBP2206831.1 membrane protein [Rhodococcus opacus]MDV6241595.1 phage holin family protein [Rhodococcus opacus]